MVKTLIFLPWGGQTGIFMSYKDGRRHPGGTTRQFWPGQRVSTYYTYTPKTCPWRIFLGSNIHLLITDQGVVVMGLYALCWLFGTISPFLGKKSSCHLAYFSQKLPRLPRFWRKIIFFKPTSNLNVTYSPINKSKVGNFVILLVINIYLVDWRSLKTFWLTKTEKFYVFREFSRKTVQNANTPLCTFAPCAVVMFSTKYVIIGQISA